VDGFIVEIQVRTTLQDLWAQAVERLADEVGREIRYGGVPAAHAGTVERLKGGHCLPLDGRRQLSASFDSTSFD
jgi:hypothetical protein